MQVRRYIQVRRARRGKVPERVAHILFGCGALTQNKYMDLSRQDSALKVLFYEMLYDLGLIDEVPSW